MRRLSSSLAAGIMLAWLLLAGCGNGPTTGSTGTGGNGAGSSSASGIGGGSAAIVQAYCDATAGPFCEAVFKCCTDPGSLMFYGNTVEECKRRYSHGGGRCLFISSGEELYAASIDAGHTVFNQGKLDACVAHLKSMSAGGDACVESVDAVLETTCVTAFEGQLALGESCIFLPSGMATADECKHGHCDWDTHKCIALAQLGEPCGSFDANPHPFFCEEWQELLCADYPYPNPTGLACVHRGQIGEACTQSAECKSFNCDTTTNKCVLPSADILCSSP